MTIRLYFILCLFFTSGITAQHNHYLYIQSEPPQPFYLKMGSGVLNSNAGGFLILPKLQDTSISFIIGFAGNQFPPYKFTIPTMKKDKGFSLKNFGEKGWGLFDLQTLEILMGEKTGGENSIKVKYQPPITQDAFTVILAAVIDDPGLTSTHLVGKEDLMVAAVVPTVQKNVELNTGESISKSRKNINSPVEEGRKSVAEAGKSNAVKESPKIIEDKKAAVPEKKSFAANKKQVSKIIIQPTAAVKKISQEIVADGLLIVYSDPFTNGKPDTVNILIPAFKEPIVVAQLERVTEIKEPFIDSVNQPSEITSLSAEKITPESKLSESTAGLPDTNTPTSITRKDCRKVATDKDLAALKRRILTIREESDMVAAATKEFKQKCYSTDQIKSISFVFLTDEGKYKLMDAAYPFVYDPATFSGLESLLNDSYYINRFKALLR